MGSSISLNEENLITVVSVGVTGAGKSSLCNILAGKPFTQVSDGFSSGTTDALHYDVVREGMPLRIVDTVGFLSNRMNEDEWQWWFLSERLSDEEKKDRFEELASTSIFGVNVFLFIESYGRFTEESRRHFQAFKDLVGEEALRHTVLVFTHVTNAKLQAALADSELPRPLEDVVRQFQWIVGVDSKQAPKQAVTEILKVVKAVVNFNEGCRYSCDMLRATQLRREDILRRIEAIENVHRKETLKSLRWELVVGTRTHAEVLRAVEDAEAAERVDRRGCACLEGLRPRR